jgi:hypothetical protein
MYYLPPTSWWRFVAWLMIGLSVYLSYGYARSELGRKVNRPRTTPGWLMLLGLGSMLIAIGILTIPHHSSVAELITEIHKGFAEGSRTIVAVACIGAGVVFAIIGALIGASKSKDAA